MGIVFDDLAPATPGVETETAPATLLVTIPALQVFAFEPEANWMVVQLPNIEATLRQPSALQPTVGHLFIELPPLSLLFETSANDFGELDITLPMLDVLANEAEGAYLRVTLPPPEPLMLENAPEPVNLGLLVQSPGYLLSWGAVSTNVMQDTFTLSDGITSSLTAFLLDTLVFSDDLTGRWQGVVAMEDRIVLSDALRQVLRVTLADGLVLGDSLASKARVVMRMVDRLVMTDAVATQMQAIALLTDALALSDVLRQGALETISDGLVLGDDYAAALQLRTTLIDQLVLADTVEHSITVLATMADTLVLDDTAITSLQLLALLRDGITFHCRIRIDGQVYVAHVLNTTTRGFSTYDNYPFNGFCELAGKHYATGPGGLFRIGEGNDADGDAIISEVRSGLVRLGTNRLKRMPSIYLVLKADGHIALKVVTTNERDGSLQEWWYERDGRPAPAMRNDRVKLGRGLRGALWQWALVNADGGDFSLDVVEMFPLLLDGRL